MVGDFSGSCGVYKHPPDLRTAQKCTELQFSFDVENVGLDNSTFEFGVNGYSVKKAYWSLMDSFSW